MVAPRIVALIVAAGTGTRSGSSTPKQFAPVAGRPMLAWSHAALSNHPAIRQVVVVHGEGQRSAAESAAPGAVFVPGAATRRDSVRAGLEAIAREGGADRVLVHDAARPFVPARIIEALLAALDGAPGAVPVLPLADTLAQGGDQLGEVRPRDGLVRVQTPQAFDFATLLAAHRAWPHDAEATDDAQVVRAAGGQVALITGDPALDKITFPADFDRAERLVPRETRSAAGFDVHRLEAGEELWLGGVLVPHDKGLSGHSDADVALHAITDALLGTIAAGDIGTHFPPSDPQWKGADSARFLQHAASLVEAEGGRISFIDLTLMCEMPKVGPHRASMQARIAELLRLDAHRVSIKATTTERLGFTGRGEGIAAQAIATITLPAPF
ncbi:bifunctional 2-C-methyl-D-erythritol 4-phosphate cytidylyltransferase/2-C-methyl-D-erythritol 2,4-cyclodiphosphate synthase [Sphingomonas japonica]|uniref:Bifunctional enzyme IspD/IspF n=1 Tax=Sphingomonas japonica TaxID=511662 RepID=A0ABX0U4Y6_9SPHN|nr:bifunctional 2-C-methyl-D-erythritol 4-phosphate cytidylyltransferase/2-C-methyl-D-erythritol 2,4-cyclodiphosphate synthase [Sphingomonas japonica]NIJ24874.1 2-C-methyl-D-erythritol 4-phosphate cytidylyltransferase/2-C-methyl-D-erythritol 2,4-cyclodiphosphate synthase [Sphingomonas japonica]